MQTIHNLETLKTFIQSITDKTFEISTDTQSFNVYPTNHVEIVFSGQLSIEVGVIVYDNLTINETVIEHLEKLIPLMYSNSEEVGDYISLNCCDDNTFNISFGGLDYDVETFNYDSIVDVMTKIELFEFEEEEEEEEF